MNRKTVTLTLPAIAGILAALFFWPKTNPRSQGLLSQDVYVWQRVWNGTVEAAVAEHASNFAELVTLKAEVSWRNKQPRVVQVALDYPAVRQAGRSIGLALRIGSYSGPFQSHDSRTVWLAELAASLLKEASAHEVHVAELQIDFDCAESKLEGYRVWVEAIRRRIAPVPVTITALPAWLDHSACKRLLEAADGYVLQVHSLARPRDADMPFCLCDPAAARRAVERAARFGKPFRVALPTYGYRIAFQQNGRFAGLSAEGPEKLWPAGAHLREVRADPAEMAQLVLGWQIDRPRALTGLIWYRLPVAGDTLNWSWPTLASVMEGRVPRPALQIETRRTQPELVEVDLVNAGQSASVAPVCITLSWSEARFVAGDGLHGYELAENGANGVRLSIPEDALRLEAGQRRAIGWVRLDRPVDVRVELPPEKN